MTQLVTYNSLVGYEIEKRRLAKGMEQGELARRCGISQPVLSRLEKGKAGIGVDQLFVICNQLGVKPSALMSEVDKAVDAIRGEEAVDVKTMKEASESKAGVLLTGAAIGAVLTLLLSRK
jgi:transcriptional regulator with XRE-family HTH domain